MADFQFLRSPVSKKWVVLAPRRAERPNVGKKSEILMTCPFCIGREAEEKELYRIGGEEGDSNWRIRVTPNKFPFAPIHEIIIHSPDHHKNFDELPFSQVELIIQTYRQRYNANHRHGQVYIFNNHGSDAGESLPHPHTQLVVIPQHVSLAVEPLDARIYKTRGWLRKRFEHELLETEYFLIFCPDTSEWPDEVWMAPKRHGDVFGGINDKEAKDIAFVISRLVQIYDLRNGSEFPFNFYIYPGKSWYLRLIPRIKILGGFELGTNMIVNTKNPKETFAFIKEHFWEPNVAKIKAEHQVDYWKSV